MHKCIKFILFWNNTLHVSDRLSVHHQQFKNVHRETGICQTDTVVCLPASRQQYLFVAVCTFFNSWWWTERQSETSTVSFKNKINFYTLVHLVAFTIEIIATCFGLLEAIFRKFVYIGVSSCFYYRNNSNVFRLTWSHLQEICIHWCI